MVRFHTEKLSLFLFFLTAVHGKAASTYGNSTTAATLTRSPHGSANLYTPSPTSTRTAGDGHVPLYTLSQIFDSPRTFIHGPPLSTPAAPPPGGNPPIQTPGFQNPGKVEPSYELTPAAPTPFQPVPVTKASLAVMPPYWLFTQTTLLRFASPAPPQPSPQAPAQTPAPVQSPNDGAPPAQNPNNAPAPPATSPHSPLPQQTTLTVPPLPLPLPPAPTPALILSNTPLTPNTPLILPPTTLSPANGPPTTITGQTILISAGILHVGTLTAALPVQTPGLPVPAPLVLGGMTFSPVPAPAAPLVTAAPVVVAGVTVSYIPGAGDVVLGSKTLLLGEVATISGTPVSLGPGGLVIGATTGAVPVTTVKIPAGTEVDQLGVTGVGGPVVIAGATASYIPGVGGVVIGTKTLLSGSAATISGTPVSLGPGGLVIGTATVVLPTGLGSTPPAGTGLGAVILSALNGGAGGAAPTATKSGSGNATATTAPFVAHAGRGRGGGRGMLGVGLGLGLGLVVCL